jgi:hypothetical protein
VVGSGTAASGMPPTLRSSTGFALQAVALRMGQRVLENGRWPCVNYAIAPSEHFTHRKDEPFICILS